MRRTQSAAGAATACTGSGGQFARSLFLAHLPDESRARAARQVSAASAWFANQVQNGRSAPMRSMLPESRRHGHGQWPRWSARMNWGHALAWSCRLTAGATDRRGERRPQSSNPLVRTLPAAHMLVSVGVQVAGRRAAAPTGSFASACSALRVRAGRAPAALRPRSERDPQPR